MQVCQVSITVSYSFRFESWFRTYLKSARLESRRGRVANSNRDVKVGNGRTIHGAVKRVQASADEGVALGGAGGDGDGAGDVVSDVRFVYCFVFVSWIKLSFGIR